MPRIRNASETKAVADSLRIEAKDVAEDLYPTGIPLKEDGSVVQDEDVPVETVRRTGAVSQESARRNKAQSRMIHRKQSGEKNVRFNSNDALEVYDSVFATFGSGNVWITVSRTDPGPPVTYPVVKMQGMRGSADCYAYVEKCHGRSDTATYMLIFKEANLERGRGLLYMPDTRNASEGPATQSPWGSFPPPQPPGNLPPQGFPTQGTPFGYPPAGYGPYPTTAGQHPGYPQHPQGMGHLPHQAPSAREPEPRESQPPVFVMPPYPQQPMQPPQQPPQTDPALMYSSYAMASEMQRMQQMMQQTLLQNAQLMGEIQAARQQQVAAPPVTAQSPLPPAPQQVPQHFTPQYPQQQQPPQYMGQPAQFTQQGQQGQQGFAGQQQPMVAVAPPVVQAQVVPAAPVRPPPSPLQTMQENVQQFTGMLETMQGLQGMVSKWAGGQPVGAQPQVQEQEMEEAPPEEASPVITQMVGVGDKSFPLQMYKATGEVNVGATVLGMVPLVGSLVNEAISQVKQIQDRQQAAIAHLDAQRAHHARTVEMVLPAHQQMQQPIFQAPPPSPTSFAAADIPWGNR